MSFKKIYFVVIMLLLICINQIHSLYKIDYINDEYKECSNGIFYHSDGLLSYGAHTNTFHLRYYFFRVNYQFSNLIFFITLNGSKDTHIPETNYHFFLNNINLYDYGVSCYLPFNLFFSFRGSSSLLYNNNTYMILRPHYYIDNPGEFEYSLFYIPYFKTSAGIRIGYLTDVLSIIYTQSDFRHSTPITFSIMYNLNNFYIRALLYTENNDPLTWRIEDYIFISEFSSGYKFKMNKDLDFLILSKFIYHYYNNNYAIILEESLRYNIINCSFREIINNSNILFEISLSIEFEKYFRFGLNILTDGKYYLGMNVNF